MKATNWKSNIIRVNGYIMVIKKFWNTRYLSFIPYALNNSIFLHCVSGGKCVLFGMFVAAVVPCRPVKRLWKSCVILGHVPHNTANRSLRPKADLVELQLHQVCHTHRRASASTILCQFLFLSHDRHNAQISGGSLRWERFLKVVICYLKTLEKQMCHVSLEPITCRHIDITWQAWLSNLPRFWKMSQRSLW